jgi:hypothetical protein
MKGEDRYSGEGKERTDRKVRTAIVEREREGQL